MKNIKNLEELKLELCKMADVCECNPIVVYTEEVLFNMESPVEPNPLYMKHALNEFSRKGSLLSSAKYPGIITKSMSSLSTKDYKKTFDIAYIEPDELKYPMTINCLLNQLNMVDGCEEYETFIVNEDNKRCDLYCALWFCGDQWTCFLIATDKTEFDEYSNPNEYSKTKEMEDE